MKMRILNQNEADPHGGDRIVNEASQSNEPFQDKAQTVMQSNPEEMDSKPHQIFTVMPNK